MTAHFYGINNGEAASAATVETSTQTKDVEIQVDGTKILDRVSLIVALEKLIRVVMQKPFPPA